MQQSSGTSGAAFTPLVVLELAPNTKEEAIAWLLSRIRDKQPSGGEVAGLACRDTPAFNPCTSTGADLMVEPLGPGVGGQDKDNPHVFMVGATRQRLLSGAEEVGLFKEYNDGSMRGFTCANKHNFTEFTGKPSLLLLTDFSFSCFILTTSMN